jgi:hypothetical protein
MGSKGRALDHSPDEAANRQLVERANRRKSVAIFKAFDFMSENIDGLLAEDELAVGDEDIVIPVGGKVTNLGASGSSIVVEPNLEQDNGILDLPNPEMGDEFLIAAGRCAEQELHGLCEQESAEEWLLPVATSIESCNVAARNLDKLHHSGGPQRPRTGYYVTRPSKLRPPTQRSGLADNTRIGDVSDCDISPATSRLRYLEKHPDLAFSGSRTLPNETRSLEKRKKTNLEKHYDCWGVSRLPSLSNTRQ